jgi:spoIIIJ-associated protein
MRSVESEGEDIDEAIGNALQTLQVRRDQVEVEILSDATRGLFGFGGKKARVRATVRAPLTSQLRTEDVETDSRETFATPPAAPSTRDAGRQTLAVEGQPPEAVAARSKAILTELIAHLGVTGTVEARGGDDPGAIVLDVKGDSGGLLIGRRGQTLDALEYIVNRIVARGDDVPPGRVMIDVERYRERRREYLTELAHRLADKVKQSHRVVTLNPMSPRDRRIVHIALSDDEAVTTRSQGDGHYRKMLIVPAGGSRKERQSRPAN